MILKVRYNLSFVTLSIITIVLCYESPEENATYTFFVPSIILTITLQFEERLFMTAQVELSKIILVQFFRSSLALVIKMSGKTHMDLILSPKLIKV